MRNRHGSFIFQVRDKALRGAGPAVSGRQAPDEAPGLWTHSPVPSVPAPPELPAAISLGLASADTTACLVSVLPWLS